MNQFKEFGIKPAEQAFAGEKIKIDRILNKKIVVHHFRIEDSKFEGKGKRLDIQIEVEGIKRLVFTSSGNLIGMIQKVPQSKFPFTTTIIKDNDRFEFT